MKDHTKDFLVFVGILVVVGALLYLAGEIPQLGGPLTETIKDFDTGNTTCNGSCNSWSILIPGVVAASIIGLVGLTLEVVKWRREK